jgi:hypothetical protein
MEMKLDILAFSTAQFICILAISGMILVLLKICHLGLLLGCNLLDRHFVRPHSLLSAENNKESLLLM